MYFCVDDKIALTFLFVSFLAYMLRLKFGNVSASVLSKSLIMSHDSCVVYRTRTCNLRAFYIECLDDIPLPDSFSSRVDLLMYYTKNIIFPLSGKLLSALNLMKRLTNHACNENTHRGKRLHTETYKL